ncbi:MAG: DUF3987 domain-containing protein [Deltaproteobacteria bacterium]|nr:DUF3987 domain-containing protein [Deltaproteobacteria bacterium]
MENLISSKEDVNRYFQGHWSDFYSRFLPDIKKAGAGRFMALCPFHPDSNPSLSISDDSGGYHCFGCEASGDAFKFYGRLKNISSFPEILKAMCEEFSIPVSGGGFKAATAAKSFGARKPRMVTAYDYTDEKNALVYQVVRFDPKGFRQRRPDGKGGWVWNMEGVRRVLYRLAEVVKANGWVLIAEGEKDADKVRALGFTATTNAGGADKWRAEYNEALTGKDVVLLPDNDKAGRGHVDKIAKSLIGVAKSIRILELPNRPDKGDVSDWIEAGGTKKELDRLIEECPLWEEDEDEKDVAKKLFPRGPFPWDVLPSGIAESLNQLARSCATSPTSLPGAAIAIFASLVGSVVSVSPKRSWKAPLIFWFCDIRASGEGKTPAARELCRVLYDAQSKAEDDHKAKMKRYSATPKKDRGEPPEKQRGYFVTDLTLEGLREDHSGHGGKVCIMDEASAFLSAQNQYKGGKGSDREAWINLYDGKPARIVRVGKTIWLKGARISIFGGIQPAIWKVCFKGGDGVYLVDGTVFRFLPVYEGPGFHPLTAEAWSEENRRTWEGLLQKVMAWSDSMQEAREKKDIVLKQDAQEAFLGWGNELKSMIGDLPSAVRGFIPKLIGCALRFAGVLYLMDVFSRGEEPGGILHVEDVKKGMRVSEFYLGHIIAAMELLEDDGSPEPFAITEQVTHLAKTLDAMRSEIDSGRLAVGYIWKRFNENCRKEQRVKKERGMGAILRRCGLSIADGKLDANHRRRVKCLQWDENVDGLIRKCLQSLQNEEDQGVRCGDIPFSTSAKSPENEDAGRSMETSETNGIQRLHGKVTEMIENGDVGDLGEIAPHAGGNSELDWDF